MRYPLISIVLPCYNGASFLEKALRSCLLQTYPALEIVFVDDCSTDNSCQIAESVQQEFPDKALRILKNEMNVGLPASLNVGHRAAKGKYLTWTSDDNLLLPEMIEKLYDRLIERSADIVYADYRNINEKGEFLNRMKLQPISSVLFYNPVGASFLYKRSVYEELDGYNEALFRLEDYDFWLRASVRFQFHHIPQVLYQYRQHPGSLTHDMEINRSRKREIEGKARKLFRDFFAGLTLSMSAAEVDLQLALFLKRGVHRYTWQEMDSYLSKWQAINKTEQIFDNRLFERELLQQLSTYLHDDVSSMYNILELARKTTLWSESQLSWLDRWSVMIRNLFNLRAAPIVGRYLRLPTSTSSPSGVP